ncbi:MAG: MFS transporter [Propionibacteriaceae bacterium]|nr:MFS transporter [Propionibacteriaceae bacterium]
MSQSPNQRSEVLPAHWLRDVTLFLGGQAVSMIGTSIVGYAVIWYIALDTQSGWRYALAYIATNLSQAFTSIPGGAWADRYNRKMLLIVSDSVTALVTIGLAVAFLRGYTDLWLILLVLATRGFASGVQSPTSSATLQQLVPVSKMMRVNSLNGTVQSLVFLASPAIAALLITRVSLGWIFMIDVVTAVIGIGFLLLVRVPPLEHTDAVTSGAGADSGAAPQRGLKSYFVSTLDAVRFVRGFPGLWRAAMIFVFLLAFAFAPTFMTPVFVVRYFGDESWMLAAAEVTWSVGTIVGGLIMAAWGGLRNRMKMIIICSFAWCAFTFGLALSPSIWPFAVFMTLFGLSYPPVQTALITSAQENVPPEKMGRVMGMFSLILSLVTPISMAIFGPLSDIIDMRIVWVAGATIGAVYLGFLALKGGPGSTLMAKTAEA